MAPIPLSFLRISSKDIGFVRMSAGLSLPATLHRANMHSSLTGCWTHRTLVSVCRSFPTHVRFAMDRAVLESTWMIRRISHSRSRANAWIPIPSQAAFTKARYSASPLERSTVACVKLQCIYRRSSDGDDAPGRGSPSTDTSRPNGVGKHVNGVRLAPVPLERPREPVKLEQVANQPFQFSPGGPCRSRRVSTGLLRGVLDVGPVLREVVGASGQRPEEPGVVGIELLVPVEVAHVLHRLLDRGLLTFLDHFLRSLFAITFFDHFFRSLFSLTFCDHFFRSLFKNTFFDHFFQSLLLSLPPLPPLPFKLET